MRKSVSLAWAIIIAHLAVNYFHGAAHVTLSIGLADWEREFVAIVILLAPILAGVMLLLEAAAHGRMAAGGVDGRGVCFWRLQTFYCAGRGQCVDDGA